MNVVVTGAGLVATAYAREAIAKGCTVTFIDPEPRQDYLRFKLGDRGWNLVRKDIRDLALVTISGWAAFWLHACRRSSANRWLSRTSAVQAAR